VPQTLPGQQAAPGTLHPPPEQVPVVALQTPPVLQVAPDATHCVPSQQLVPVHVVPQQACAAPPQVVAVQAPAVHVLPLAQGAPGATQRPPSQQPAVHGVPVQHASPAAPQTTHPCAGSQTTPGPAQVLPGQQGWLTLPQALAMHRPLVLQVNPPEQGWPTPTHCVPSQHPVHEAWQLVVLQCPAASQTPAEQGWPNAMHCAPSQHPVHEVASQVGVVQWPWVQVPWLLQVSPSALHTPTSQQPLLQVLFGQHGAWAPPQGAQPDALHARPMEH
jgi:hypothetical protein